MNLEKFTRWFRSLTGHDPMPWQEELYARFMGGDLPDAVDIPTGLGKTTIMTIWLIAQACGAKVPTRLAYVVDRRAVVDQATDEAMKLRDGVGEDPELKSALGLRENQALPISTLRGQYVDNREWLDDPTSPAIIVGTVDMIGSRLLFEGYGVSRKMRPYHAGLLGVDTLVVLDEAHLVPPFEHLLRSIASEPSLRGRDESCQQIIPPFKVLPLSATGRAQGKSRFQLTEKDFEHELVKERLSALKSMTIIPCVNDEKLEDVLAERAWALADEGKKAMRVLVYADSREVARKAKVTVEKLAKGDKKQGKPAVKIESELFVGSRRVFEREAAKQWLKEHGLLAGSGTVPSGPVFLFATSAGEVGVDLDADHMVCDLVAWERMVQRLGRVNRRGKGKAHVIVILKPQPKANKWQQDALDKRDRGEELNNSERKWVEKYEKEKLDWENHQKPIRQLPKNDDGAIDASPGALLDLKMRAETDESLRKMLDEAVTPEPLRPELTRPLVDAWSMTSLEKHTGRPAIQPWLRGWIKDDPPQTALVWRKHLPVRRSGPAPHKKEIEAFFEAAPPHLSEILETETFRVIDWLEKRHAELIKQKTVQAEVPDEHPLRETDVVAFVLDADGSLRKSFVFKELAQIENFKAVLEGATLILDARIAGLKDGLLHDNADDLPRTADDGQNWLDEGVVGFRIRSIEASATVSGDKGWHQRYRFASAVTEDGEPTRWLIVEKWRQIAATEEDRSTSRPQLLDEHQSWTEERARRLAKAAGLDDELTEVLALAARHHDEGKRAARWQRAFHAPKDGIYAKTEGPIDYRLLDGYRHELGSLLRVENDKGVPKLSAENRDLLLHLIVAHHGFARPVIGTTSCDDAPPSALETKAAEIAIRFARLQDHWGPWGLAWWEALLRAADQQASRDNELRAATGGD
ncbi:type I-G CRISPR-associated helicase/endonuclease Cas3g [Rehaibacterium terrae]|jgi:CRISPR-associated endonuclease/helicase Cas3|uniref:CRISPR-associated endonuclease/helicase Cas3 n=1 Tax=Rehaibacterium terrae TaxID=1341696 RepID=A0A7W8DFK0_9GAMM|nr:type I-U CRISPR-associated helicase/endonuclease Cas3 [Rehaibacterium terrae]MBB5016455.1 CRISPR-associated endonuclease/helicase Cas3 [Rehaibacterium terrae]